MYILGLTGSIGMGKTTAAQAFRHFGVSVYDADATVHHLTGPGGKAVAAVGEAFPGVVKDGQVDRSALGPKVFDDKAALATLEAILHPMVRGVQYEYLRQAAKRHEKIVVLDVPLLFEVGTDQICDGVAVVTAPKYLQKIRVLSRPGMTEDRLAQVLESQMPDSEKRKRADFLIQTSMGRNHSLLCIRNIITIVQNQPGRNWPLKQIRQPK
ncbi:MAG: dephospho-CoA kinase [Rhodospirillaceae bacterium]|jgi:dephospho-CoA kinase|nr:dephospho-CoA kinase [Rhodospirillaceae bacterium]MBT5941487.1 dephospho-CoA kinase [Rhodospirillaceae bacterium]MBT7957207.1 dephospho-CoA kinase [Rhodospirillaceae bacterium]